MVTTQTWGKTDGREQGSPMWPGVARASVRGKREAEWARLWGHSSPSSSVYYFQIWGLCISRVYIFKPRKHPGVPNTNFIFLPLNRISVPSSLSAGGQKMSSWAVPGHLGHFGLMLSGLSAALPSRSLMAPSKLRGHHRLTRPRPAPQHQHLCTWVSSVHPGAGQGHCSRKAPLGVHIPT